MRDKRGFTLVEIIVAIAALAIAGVFVMRMYVITDTLSKRSALRSRTLDISSGIAEHFKASDSYFDFLEILPMDDEVLEDVKTHWKTPFSLVCYYNQHGYEVEDESDAHAKLDIAVKLLEEEKNGSLMTMTFTSSVKEKGEYQEQFQYTVTRYYPEPATEVTPCDP